MCVCETRTDRQEKMEASDGLLLQVNNGEQWCNRWKHPNDDSVSSRSSSGIGLFLRDNPAHIITSIIS